MMTRREFIQRIALVAILATPVGRYLYGKWSEARPKTLNGLMDYKGYEFLDTGYVYAPYIPRLRNEFEFDPNISLGMRTRYSKKIIASDCYLRNRI